MHTRIMTDQVHTAWWITALAAAVLPLAVVTLALPSACDASKTAAPQAQSAPASPAQPPAPPATPPQATSPPIDERASHQVPTALEKPVQVAEASPPPAEAPKSAVDSTTAAAPPPSPEAPAPETPAPAQSAPLAETPKSPVDSTTAAAPPPAPETTAPEAPAPAQSPPPAETPKSPTDSTTAAAPPPAPETPAPAPAPEPPKPASRFSLFGLPVRTWAIQLQSPDPEAIARTPYDLVVIDYSRDASAEGAFSKADVARMKTKPDGTQRLLIAYMSIGEVEDYRYYWAQNGWNKKAKRPSWIGKENPEWLHNYTVKFWNQGWKDVIYAKPDSYLDKLIDAGFDGVYLDKIDITDDLEGQTPKGTTAFGEMVKFLQGISAKANERTGHRFALVASNAESALDNDTYRAVMHAIGKEDLFYNSHFDGRKLIDGFPNDKASIDEQVRLLDKLVEEKKLVLAVEYLDSKPELIPPTAKKHLALGHIPYFGPRDLARLSGTTFAQAARVGSRGAGGAPSLSLSVRKSASCTGMSESDCGNDSGCVWIHGYNAGEVDVPGYCRIAPASTVLRLGAEKRE